MRDPNAAACTWRQRGREDGEKVAATGKGGLACHGVGGVGGNTTECTNGWSSARKQLPSPSPSPPLKSHATCAFTDVDSAVAERPPTGEPTPPQLATGAGGEGR